MALPKTLKVVDDTALTSCHCPPMPPFVQIDEVEQQQVLEDPLEDPEPEVEPEPQVPETPEQQGPQVMWMTYVVPNSAIGAQRQLTPHCAEMMFAGQGHCQPPAFSNVHMMDLIMSKLERYKRILRFKEKKMRFHQMVRYKARQQLAYGKSRFNGKFVSREKLGKIAEMELIDECEHFVLRKMKEHSHKIFKIEHNK